MSTSEQPRDGSRPARDRPGRLLGRRSGRQSGVLTDPPFGPLLGAVATVLLILSARTLTAGVGVGGHVTQRSCQEQYCAERVEQRDLLVVAGSRTVRVIARDAAGHPLPRFLIENDPFDDLASVRITWVDGGVSLSDGAAVLRWDARALAGLAD